MAAVDALLSSTYATAATAAMLGSTAGGATATHRSASATHAPHAAAAAAPRASTFVPAPLHPGAAQPHESGQPSYAPAAPADEAAAASWRGRLNSPTVASTPPRPFPGSLADLAAGRPHTAAAAQVGRPRVPPPKSSGLGAGVQQPRGLMWVTTQMLPCGGAAAPATAASTAAAAAAAAASASAAAAASATASSTASAAAAAAWTTARVAPPPLPQPRPDALAAVAPRPGGAASGLLLLSGGAEGAAAPDAKRQKLTARAGAVGIPAAEYHPPAGVQVGAPGPSLDGGGVLNRGLRRHLRAHEVEALPWLARDRPVAPASLPTSVSEGPFSMGSPAGTPPAVAAAPAAGPGPYQPPDLNKAHTEAPCNTKSVCRRTPNFRASDSEEVPPVCRMPAPMVGGRGAEKSTEEGLSETRARY